MCSPLCSLCSGDYLYNDEFPLFNDSDKYSYEYSEHKDDVFGIYLYDREEDKTYIITQWQLPENAENGIVYSIDFAWVS